MIFNVLAEGRRRRGNRWEPEHVGTVEADTLAEAERLAREKWPGLTLRVLTPVAGSGLEPWTANGGPK
jgi:hypothetical protein